MGCASKEENLCITILPCPYVIRIFFPPRVNLGVWLLRLENVFIPDTSPLVRYEIRVRIKDTIVMLHVPHVTRRGLSGHEALRRHVRTMLQAHAEGLEVLRCLLADHLSESDAFHVVRHLDTRVRVLLEFERLVVTESTHEHGDAAEQCGAVERGEAGDGVVSYHPLE